MCIWKPRNSFRLYKHKWSQANEILLQFLLDNGKLHRCLSCREGFILITLFSLVVRAVNDDLYTQTTNLDSHTLHKVKPDGTQ